MNSMNITTTSLPKVDKCTIIPQSGLAEITLFTITCFRKTNAKYIFEYYQNNKNDNATLGKLRKNTCTIFSKP